MVESLAPIARRLWQMLRALGWLYAGALALAFASLAAFAALADEVLERELDAFNRQVLAFVEALSSPAWNPAVVALTDLGSAAAVLLVGGFFALLFVRLGRTVDAAVLAIVLAGGGALSGGLKLVFAQARPDVFKPLVVETSYSFPSGHALLSFCLYGYLAFWIVARGPRSPWRFVAAACLVLLATLIALSRVYLGVHWPTDIAAGALVALFWLAVCLLGRRWYVARFRVRPES